LPKGLLTANLHGIAGSLRSKKSDMTFSNDIRNTMKTIGNVEIFKTDIENDVAARRVVAALAEKFPDTRFNVDLHDPDRILRMQGPLENKNAIISLTTKLGYKCELIV
jgi:hypothetical protein